MSATQNKVVRDFARRHGTLFFDETNGGIEHVVIPELHETIRFIFDKLAEAERDNISRLMKITDIIRA